MLVEDLPQALTVDGHELQVVHHLNHFSDDLVLQEFGSIRYIHNLLVALESLEVVLLEAQLQVLELFHSISLQVLLVITEELRSQRVLHLLPYVFGVKLFIVIGEDLTRFQDVVGLAHVLEFVKMILSTLL